VFLTVTGQAEAEEAAGWHDVLLEAVRTLDLDEQAALYRALLKTVRTLQVRGRIPVSQMCVTCTFFRPYAHAGERQPHHCALVDAPFGDVQVRLDCPDHQAAPPESAERAWAVFTADGQGRREEASGPETGTSGGSAYILRVVVAGAWRTEPAGTAGAALRVRVAAPPAQGDRGRSGLRGGWRDQRELAVTPPSMARQMRSRSPSESPPQTPCGSRLAIA
jgi:hypothetical protein